jgi:hypothetical protein
MASYLKDVLGLNLIYQESKEKRDPQDIQDLQSSQEIDLFPGDWVWIGPDLDSLPVFHKMIEALSNYWYQKEGLSFRMLLWSLDYGNILKTQHSWPDQITFVCVDPAFYSLFLQTQESCSSSVSSQSSSFSCRILLIPHPKDFASNPALKKQAWKVLIER